MELQAAASRKRMMTPERIEREQVKLDTRIAQYLEAMGTADPEESQGECIGGGGRVCTERADLQPQASNKHPRGA
jgi:hypothetical protein